MTLSLFQYLRHELGLVHIPDAQVSMTDADPVYPMPFRIGEASAAVLALQGVMLDALRVQQGMPSQQISVDCRSAHIYRCGPPDITSPRQDCPPGLLNIH